MSVEDELELKDLLFQTLKSNGCLAKVRAHLRASVFLALDEEIKMSSEQPFSNNKLKSYLETSDGQLMFCVVREFLEFFNLEFTISVFDPESYSGVAYCYEGKNKIIQDLGLNFDEKTVPLLLQIFKLAQRKSKTLEVNLNLAKEDVDNSCDSKESDHILETELSCTNIDNSANNSGLESHISLEAPENPTDDCKQILNETFNISRPSNNHQHKMESTEDNCVNMLDLGSKENATSSVDDSFFNKINDLTLAQHNTNQALSSVSEHSNDEIKPPVLKESKFDNSLDKLKFSPQKSDKLKSKNSLPDLSPINPNKTRASGILPSLYSKELKDKSNAREQNTFIEADTSFEEEFSSESDMNLNAHQGDLISKRLNEVLNNSVADKSKNSLSSLSDLPSLTSKIPSAYNSSRKERNKKLSLQDIETFLDADIEYEEDFTTENDANNMKSDLKTVLNDSRIKKERNSDTDKNLQFVNTKIPCNKSTLRTNIKLKTQDRDFSSKISNDHKENNLNESGTNNENVFDVTK